jgi:hypothetical protein
MIGRDVRLRTASLLVQWSGLVATNGSVVPASWRPVAGRRRAGPSTTTGVEAEVGQAQPPPPSALRRTVAAPLLSGPAQTDIIGALALVDCLLILSG